MSIIANKKAFHDYFIEERFEAGIALDPPPGWDAEQAGAERSKRLPPPDPAVLEACEPSKR